MSISKYHQQVTSGYALVMVLWLTTVITFITSMAYSSSRTETALTRNSFLALKGKSIAEAGLWLVMEELQNVNALTQHNTSLQLQTVYFDNIPVDVEIRDVAGKINLNHAPRELIFKLLASSTITQSEAEAISFHIADWIDNDIDSAISINENDIYNDYGLNHLPSNKPFSTLDELRLVAGMSDLIFRDISPFLTLYGSHSYVNINAASPDLIKRLELGNLNDETWENRHFSTATSNIYTVKSTVQLDGASTNLNVVIETLPLGRNESFRLLDWDK